VFRAAIKGPGRGHSRSGRVSIPGSASQASRVGAGLVSYVGLVERLEWSAAGRSIGYRGDLRLQIRPRGDWPRGAA